MAGVSQKIVGGQYDFEKNVLNLEIEVQNTGDSSSRPRSHIEHRAFEVANLQLRMLRSNSASPTNGNDQIQTLDVLGARSKQSIDKIMKTVIEGLRELGANQVDDLINNAMRHEASIGEVKKLHFSSQTGATGTQVEVSKLEYIQAGDGSYKALTDNYVPLSTGMIASQQVRSTVLTASNWQDMIKPVSNQEGADHSWTEPSDATFQSSKSDLTSVLNHFNAHPNLLTEACQNYKNQSNAFVKSINDRMGLIHDQIREDAATLTQLKANAQILREDKQAIEGALKQRHQVLDKEYQALDRQRHYIEKVLSNLLRDLAIELSVKKVASQMFLHHGNAPIGSFASKSWDRVVSKYGLIPSNASSLDDHLKGVLGLNLQPLAPQSKEHYKDQSKAIFARATPVNGNEADFYSANSTTDDDDDETAAPPAGSNRVRRLRKRRGDLPVLNLVIDVDDGPDEGSAATAAEAASSANSDQKSNQSQFHKRSVEATVAALKSGLTEENLRANLAFGPYIDEALNIIQDQNQGSDDSDS